ncbi:MAG: SDR family oxidoreductase, partial [Pseudomonadota bacterium]
ITAATISAGAVSSLKSARDHDVAITYRTTDPAALLADAPDVLPIQADLREETAPAEIVAAVIERFGRLDVVVNNAGSVAALPLETADYGALRDMFDTNVTGPMAVLAAALPHLEAGASVINITSVNARLPPMSAPAYGASKAALETYTKAAAKILGPKGIRVNAVAPGATEIPEAPRPDELNQLFMKDTALGRVGRPEDIARVVRFFAEDASAWVTGTVLDASGGYRL